MKRDLVSTCLVVVATLAAVVTPATAQSETQTQGASDEVARGLFQAGRASYDAGQYEDALKYFQQAFDLSQRAALLYNIGQAADRLHQDAKTVESFRQYLAQVPDAPNRAEVEGRLRTLERLMELERAEAEAAATTTNDSTRPEQPTTESQTVTGSAPATATSAGIAPWLVVGGGGAVLAAGVVLAIIGTGQISDVENPPSDPMFEDFRSKADSGPMLATTGIVLMAVGAVGAAVGLVWALGSGDDGSNVQVSVGPGSLAITGAL